MIEKLSVEQVKSVTGKQQPFALIDVREQEEFSQQHQLLSCCIPYSRIESVIVKLVPGINTLIILTDSGSNQFMRSERAARIVEALGYTQVFIQDGGIKAWSEAGYETFEGVNVLSKALGELVAETCGTPLTRPEVVDEMLRAGKKIAILDVRPNAEFNNMCIPGGKNTPGSELLYRLSDQVTDADTHILVNCAGRTRGILGAQSLINAKVPNPVSALKGGTMGWELADLKLEYGQTRYTGLASVESARIACDRAAAIAEKSAVKYVGFDTMKRWQSEFEQSQHCLYLFDVRQPIEYLAGHYPGSINAQGGQLVQATDEYAAVRCARYVLLDDSGARANLAASWMTQMGYPEVYVLRGGIAQVDMVTGETQQVDTTVSSDNSISAEYLHTLYARPDLLVIDVGYSNSYKAGHIPGSKWVPRSRISLALTPEPALQTLVIISDSTDHARKTMLDAAEFWPDVNIVTLTGGRESWIEGGYPVNTGMDGALCTADDIWYKPYEDTEADPADMQCYFDWEYDLVSKIKRDGDAHFNVVVF